MNNEYFIDKDNIQKLVEVCDTFDNACQECVDNRNNSDYETTRDFGFSFEQLSGFAKENPHFDYQAKLPNHQHILSYFFSGSLEYSKNKAMRDYSKRMEFYD